MIEESRHFINRCMERGIRPEIIKDCLLSKDNEILGIMKTESRFKLMYAHPRKPSKDIYVIINLNLNESKISLVTTYLVKNDRRLRTHD